METVKRHPFKLDLNDARSISRNLCECGKGYFHPTHTTNVRMVQGTATPEKTG